VGGAIGLCLAIGSIGFYAVRAFDARDNGPKLARVPQPRAPVKNRLAPVRPQRQPAALPPRPDNVAAAPPAADPLPANAGGTPLPPRVPQIPGRALSTPVVPRAPVPRAPGGDIPIARAKGFAPAPARTPAAPPVGEDQNPIGGSGGFAFRSASPDAQPVVGFRYVTGSWAGKTALSRLDPLFASDMPARGGTSVAAKPGYVVGGLELDTSDFVHAVRVVFVRQDPGGGLDPADNYTSDWLGTPAGNAPQKLSGGTNPVIGVHGRRGAVIDALGLVVGKP
jgi:hypothetical protein